MRALIITPALVDMSISMKDSKIPLVRRSSIDF